MDKFGQLYSKYYDVLYAQKNYKKEVDCVDFWIKKFNKNSKNILSLGAGTLNHETLLLKKGYHIWGLDKSENMVSLARNKIEKEHLKNLTIDKGDMLNFSNKNKFDVILALFNVLGYCDGKKDLEKILNRISNSISPGGLFIFDVWNGVGINNDPPQDRWKKLSLGSCTLFRLVNYENNIKKNYIDLNFEMIEFCKKKFIQRLTEKHRVHYWYLNELKEIFGKYNFILKDSCVFPDLSLKISNNKKKWSLGLVFKKK